jgi:hypothetical protein
MKKFALLITLSGALLAVNDSWYGGFEVGSTGIKHKSSNDNVRLNDGDTGGHFALKGGRYINDNNRVYGMYQMFNTEDNTDMDAYSVGYDYLFDVYSNRHLKPVIGVNVTRLRYEDQQVDLHTNHLMPNLGVTYQTSQVDFEGGYRFSLLDDGEDDINVGGINTDIEVDRLNQFYVGANFRFKSLEENHNRQYVKDYKCDGYSPYRYNSRTITNTEDRGNIYYAQPEEVVHSTPHYVESEVVSETVQKGQVVEEYVVGEEQAARYYPRKTDFNTNHGYGVTYH